MSGEEIHRSSDLLLLQVRCFGAFRGLSDLCRLDDLRSLEKFGFRKIGNFNLNLKVYWLVLPLVRLKHFDRNV
ncbi:hypothetical protein NPIL_260861 [Nephila pilipes]|uniref:Uncharacterized protein n=1 Tax=Nephila pilipes TaxID=299642 RepID=A0A8X6Q366_NEPPI|nr:hypothetical protein NPIL_260861 [Nephila pilipes]